MIQVSMKQLLIILCEIYHNNLYEEIMSPNLKNEVHSLRRSRSRYGEITATNLNNE